jgi:hypothetical protein
MRNVTAGIVAADEDQVQALARESGANPTLREDETAEEALTAKKRSLFSVIRAPVA